MTSIVALIPARAGSKRIPGKNTRDMAGHPLIAYTIAAAKQADVFGQVYVCTDSAETAWMVGNEYGCSSVMRDPSGDTEPDFEWVREVLSKIPVGDAFAILRPTSPFRTAETIKRAWRTWKIWHGDKHYVGADSLRAVESAGQHPAKMWSIAGCWLTPLLLQPTGTPWHSSPTQTLPRVYVQNASLEIAWTETVRRTGTIAGERILAFETQGWEGFDLNTERDWWVAERAIAEGVAKLPEVT